MLALMQYALIFYDFQLILARMSRCPPSDAPSRTASKEPCDHLLAADGTDQLAQRAVDEEQHGEPELGRPEVGLDDLAHELTVRRAQVPGAPPERHEVLQVVDKHAAAV